MHQERISYRGLWLALGSLAVGVAGGMWAPQPFAAYCLFAGIAGGWIGGIIYTTAIYRDLQRYVPEREEFEKKLRER